MEMLRELIYALAWVSPFILLVFMGIVYVETGGRERIIMNFEGMLWETMHSYKNINDSNIRHNIIGPAFQILNTPLDDKIYQVDYVFNKPRFARRRFKEVEKIVQDYLLEFQEVFGIFEHASLNGKTITIKLWRVNDASTLRAT